MARSLIPALLAFALLATPAAAVDCRRPLPPDIPEGATASKEQMLSAGDTVREFMDLAERYLDCLKVQESLMPTNELSAQKQAIMAQHHNETVADMQRVAERYNTAVRAYKSRTQDTATNSPADGD